MKNIPFFLNHSSILHLHQAEVLSLKGLEVETPKADVRSYGVVAALSLASTVPQCLS